jgi:hypothetical protein
MQISWLIESSSLLNNIASTVETDPDALFKPIDGCRMSKRVQERESDRLAGLTRRATDNGKILLSEVRCFAG